MTISISGLRVPTGDVRPFDLTSRFIQPTGTRLLA